MEVSSAKRLNALHLKFMVCPDLGGLYLRVRPQGGRAEIIIDLMDIIDSGGRFFGFSTVPTVWILLSQCCRSFARPSAEL